MVEVSNYQLLMTRWPLKVTSRCDCSRVDEITFNSKDHITELINKYNHEYLKHGNIKQGLIISVHRARPCIQHDKTDCDCNFSHTVWYKIFYDEGDLIIASITGWADWDEHGDKEPNPDMTDEEIIEKSWTGASKDSWMIKEKYLNLL